MASGDVRDLREAREQLRRVVSRVEEDHPDMALQMRDLLAGSIDTPVSYTHLDVYKRQLEITRCRERSAVHGLSLIHI